MNSYPDRQGHPSHGHHEQKSSLGHRAPSPQMQKGREESRQPKQYYPEPEDENARRQRLLSNYKRAQDRERDAARQRQQEQELAEREAQQEAARQKFAAFENGLITEFETWLNKDIKLRRKTSWTRDQATNALAQYGTVMGKYAVELKSYLGPNADKSKYQKVSRAFTGRMQKLLKEAKDEVLKP
jgi:hypothetical protein